MPKRKYQIKREVKAELEDYRVRGVIRELTREEEEKIRINKIIKKVDLLKDK